MHSIIRGIITVFLSVRATAAFFFFFGRLCLPATTVRTSKRILSCVGVRQLHLMCFFFFWWRTVRPRTTHPPPPSEGRPAGGGRGGEGAEEGSEGGGMGSAEVASEGTRGSGAAPAWRARAEARPGSGMASSGFTYAGKKKGVGGKEARRACDARHSARVRREGAAGGGARPPLPTPTPPGPRPGLNSSRWRRFRARGPLVAATRRRRRHRRRRRRCSLGVVELAGVWGGGGAWAGEG